MVNNRGVSAVVATVLIVMITVAAVGLLWTIISPFLKSNIADKTACVEAEMAISIDEGSAYTCVSVSNGTAVRVSRGNDNNDWKSIQVVYTDSSGNSEKVSYAYPPAKNSEKVYRNVNMIDVVKISVLPILEGNGDDLICSKTVDLPSVKNCSGEVEASLDKTSVILENDILICGGEDVNYQNLLCLDEVYGYWPFENNLDDYSGNGYDGTAYGGAIVSDGVLNFDGVNDYVDLVDFDLPNNFSVSFWVNAYEIDSYQCFVGKHSLTGGNFFLVGFWSGLYSVNIRDASNYRPTPQRTGLHHVVVSGWENATGTSVALYADTVLLGIGYINNKLGDISGKPWTVGQDWDSSSNSDFLNGTIEDVLIFGKILTESEIIEIYNAGR